MKPKWLKLVLACCVVGIILSVTALVLMVKTLRDPSWLELTPTQVVIATYDHDNNLFMLQRTAEVTFRSALLWGMTFRSHDEAYGVEHRFWQTGYEWSVLIRDGKHHFLKLTTEGWTYCTVKDNNDIDCELPKRPSTIETRDHTLVYALL